MIKTRRGFAGSVGWMVCVSAGAGLLVAVGGRRVGLGMTVRVAVGACRVTVTVGVGGMGLRAGAQALKANTSRLKSENSCKRGFIFIWKDQSIRVLRNWCAWLRRV
jgi:hypothetical protein